MGRREQLDDDDIEAELDRSRELTEVQARFLGFVTRHVQTVVSRESTSLERTLEGVYALNDKDQTQGLRFEAVVFKHVTPLEDGSNSGGTYTVGYEDEREYPVMHLDFDPADALAPNDSLHARHQDFFRFSWGERPWRYEGDDTAAWYMDRIDRLEELGLLKLVDR